MSRLTSDASGNYGTINGAMGGWTSAASGVTDTANRAPKAAGEGTGKDRKPAAPRVISLDQLRGLAMAAMLFVNFNFGYEILPAFFTHGVVYTSGPDLVMPAFHFAVGFAYRLTTRRRMEAAAVEGKGGWISQARTVGWDILTTRVVGLIMLSMFWTEGWGQWSSWSDVGSFRDWLQALVSNPQPYHTLLHIALVCTVTFPVMSLRSHVPLLVQLVATAALHTVLLATFYFEWVQSKFLDEGGYFGFVGWSITALIGALTHDMCMSAMASPASTRAAAADTAGYGRVGDGASQTAPLLGAGAVPVSLAFEGAVGETATAFTRRLRVAARLALVACGLMLGAYLLSCLGTVAPLAVCFDATTRNFFGGFGPQIDCEKIASHSASEFFINPPFRYPSPAVVTMWSMTQRAGSVTYHLFTSGTSMFILSILFVLCEVGLPLPAWWNARWGSALLGLHTASRLPDADEFVVESEPTRLVMRWHFLEVLGENSLAVYLISDSIGDNFNNMVPPDSPTWYFLIWGELLFLSIVFVFASYLRKHKLFLRL